MKKNIRIIAVIFSLLFVVASFTGCNLFNKDNKPTDGNDYPSSESVIFGADFKIVISESLDEKYSEYLFELDNMLFALKGEATEIIEASSGSYIHEIILGETDRELSQKAYRRLGRLTDEDDDLIGYVIYSDTKSIAIAFDSVDSLELALAKLKETYFSTSYGKTDIPDGVLYDWTGNVNELYEERDAEIMAQRWTQLKAEIDNAGYDGAATVSALQNLYSLYTDDIYMWMADLYDPELGGFYYSNSGRNTLGFLPDIESTMQVLNMIRYSGMNNNPSAYPEEFRTAVVEFVKARQSSVDGYFYHPQWDDLAITDERRGRDQMWSLEILSMFGEKPYYNSGSVSGTLGAPGTSQTSYLTTPIRQSSVSAVSCVIPTATLDYLASESAFKEYLDSQDWTDAYTTGNRLAAQVTSIKAAGLINYCVDYLNGKQKENGMFDDQEGDFAVNGFLKIGAIYQVAKRVIPRSDRAAEFCLDVLLSDEPAGTVCWVYNVWYALDIIIDLLEGAGGQDNIALANSIRDDLRTNAPRYINYAASKYATFLKKDGSFSFTPDKTASYSQGMPVAVNGTNEGDVNGTYISSIGLTGYLFSALGYNKVNLYTENDYKIFMNRIEELDQIVKTGTSASGSITFTDLSNVDDAFQSTSNVVTGLRPEEFGSTEDKKFAYAVIDTEESTDDSEKEYGQVLEYGKPNSGYETRIEFANRSVNRSRFVFEFDLKFMGGQVSGGSWHTRFALYNNGRRFYSLLMYTLDDGSLAIGSRNDPIAIIPAGEWHTLRMEYYTDTQDRACKIYLDGNYVGEGGTSDPTNGDKSLSRAFIEYRNEATDLLYRFDNILVSSDDEEYVPPHVEVGDATGSHYTDPSVKGDRYDYDNAEEKLPTTLNSNGGSLTITDGRLNYGLNGAKGENAILFELPISAAEAKYENLCKLFEFEFSYSAGVGEGDLGFLLGNQEYKLIKNADSGKLDIIDKYNNNKVIAAGLAPDTVYIIRFECYEGAEKELYNITKVYINEEYAGELRSDYIGGITKFGIKLSENLTENSAYVTVENLLIANINKAYEKDASEKPFTEREPVENSPFGGGDFYNGRVDGNRFDYSEMKEGLQTDGVTSGSDDTVNLLNGMLLYNRNNIKGESYMRWNHTAPLGLSTPVFVFETDFMFDGFLDNSPSEKLLIQANGISHFVGISFDVSEGKQTMTVGKITLNEGEWSNIRFELDYAAGMIYFFKNGDYVDFDYLSNSTTTYSRVIWYYLNSQTAGSMYFDNTFEGLVENGSICEIHTDENSDGNCDNCPLEMPKEPEPEIELPENTSDGGDFYNGSTAGNRFNCDSVVSGMQIDGVSGGDKAECKDGVFIFERKNDTGSGESYIRWNHSMPTGLTTPVFVFETDFLFNEFAVDSTTFQKIVIEANGIRHQILPTLSADGLTLTIGKITVTANEWCNIRFELDYTAEAVYYFQNGEYVGSDYLASGTTGGTRVLWYYMAKQTDGYMAFDNIFEGMVENGSICQTHTDENSDGKCDNCPLEMPKEPEPEIELPENTSDGGDFYNGQEDGNRFTCDSVVSGMQIDGVSGGDKAECKDGVFIFERKNDTGSGESYIRWNHSIPTGLTTPVFVFETDFFFTGFEATSITSQMIRIQVNGIEHKITPALSSDRSSMTIGKLELSSDTWYNIRFEMDFDGGVINYFRNGIFVGSEQLSSTASSGTRVLWYYIAAQTGGIMAFDNTYQGFVEDATATE